MNQLEINNELKNLIPPLTEDEYQHLEKSILAEGCRDAIIVWNNIIIDGHNRYEICKKHGINFAISKKDMPDIEAVKDWMDANQLARRNLTPDQRQILIGRRYNREKMLHGGDRKSKGNICTLKPTAGTLADEYKVSVRTVKNYAEMANKFEQLQKEKPELAKEIFQGKKTFTEVKKEERKEIQKEKMTLAAEKHNAKTATWNLTQNQEVIKCDALITDPPYGILSEKWEPGNGAIEDVTRAWASKWGRCNADVILVFFSQRYMWQGKQWFDESFLGYEFQQLLVWHYANNKSPQSRKGFKQTWEPIFFYRKKDCKRQICVGGENWGNGLNDFDCHIAAVPQSNFNNAECKVHPAQKPVSVFRWLINAVTNPGELVCDPFAGSGTSGIAATQLQRRWHGIEIDKEYSEQAKRRIAAYGNI